MAVTMKIALGTVKHWLEIKGHARRQQNVLLVFLVLWACTSRMQSDPSST